MNVESNDNKLEENASMENPVESEMGSKSAEDNGVSNDDAAVITNDNNNPEVIEGIESIGTKRKLPKTVCLFPKTKIKKLVEDTFSNYNEERKLHINAVTAITKSGEAFARALLLISCELMKDNNRDRLKQEDVFAALKECDCEYMIPVLKTSLEEVSSGKGKNRVKISIKTLVDHNILTPGVDAIELTFKDQVVKAELTQEGEIKYEDRIFSNPSGFSLYAMQKIDPAKKSANGWETVKYNGKSLNQYKTDALSTLKIKLAGTKDDNNDTEEKKTSDDNNNNEKISSSNNDSNNSKGNANESGDSSNHGSSSGEEEDEEAQILSVFD